MAFNELYVNAGSNLNGGSSDSPTADFTYAGGTFVRATGVFTVASGNPLSDGVQLDTFASIYTTVGATNATLIGRITARDATTITISVVAGTFAGTTASVSETAAAATCKIGGAWAGPSGTDEFPIGFALGALRNAAGNQPRVNFKAGTYNITATMVANLAGPITFQGYQTTAGDGVNKGLQDTSSKAIIDGGTSGAVSYYNLLQVSSGAQNNTFTDFIFTHNGGTGSVADGVAITENENMFVRCVFHDLRRHGIKFSAVGHMVECEAYACNQANDSTNSAAIALAASGSTAIRCIAHDNVGSNCDGFAIGGVNLIECIAHSNGRNGAKDTGDNNNTIEHCDFYDNGANGAQIGTGSGTLMVTIENSNFVNNVGNGIKFMNAITMGVVHNCGFGSGTMANDAGDTSAVDGVEISGSITYAANTTPWIDPDNGDFRISPGSTARGAGRGKYLQTMSSYSGTVGFPDIGSNQSLAVASTGQNKFFLFF